MKKIVGMIQVRHYFNEYLEKYGGHIGYSITPSERCKGYTKEMLQLTLPECKKMGINKVLITCVDTNEICHNIDIWITRLRQKENHMKKIRKKETRTDVTYDYMVDRDSIFDALFRISNSKNLHVRTVMLDDLSSCNDEGTKSTTLGAIVSSEKLKNSCKENGIDIITILAIYNHKTIAISGDITTNTIGVTLRKRDHLDISQIETELKLI